MNFVGHAERTCIFVNTPELILDVLAYSHDCVRGDGTHLSHDVLLELGQGFWYWIDVESIFKIAIAQRK